MLNNEMSNCKVRDDVQNFGAEHEIIPEKSTLARISKI
jgi:hypothetical protein